MFPGAILSTVCNCNAFFGVLSFQLNERTKQIKNDNSRMFINLNKNTNDAHDAIINKVWTLLLIDSSYSFTL